MSENVFYFKKPDGALLKFEGMPAETVNAIHAQGATEITEAEYTQALSDYSEKTVKDQKAFNEKAFKSEKA